MPAPTGKSSNAWPCSTNTAANAWRSMLLPESVPRRVIEVLTQLISVHGAPRYIRSDNATEFVTRANLSWLVRANIETAYIDPGKPRQNAAGESFKGKLWDECLSLEWFRNRVDAKIVVEGWRRHYNDTRPHSSLRYRTPAAFKRLNSKANPEEIIFQE